MTRLLHLARPGLIAEYDWQMPERQPDQIKIKTIMTGICRSDIGAFTGVEAMPYSDEHNPNGILGTFGHEGLGEVVEVSEAIKDVRVGDYVSTFSDPAYADYYYARVGEYVKVPEASSKYILQPVASGVNIWNETIRTMEALDIKNEAILMLGSGFLSSIIGAALRSSGKNYQLEVVGRANRTLWDDYGFKVYNSVEEIDKKYKVVIDLSSKPENFNKIVNNLTVEEALVCYASTPTSPITTNFFDACWKCLTFIMPSPRNKRFINAMIDSRNMIERGDIDVSKLWTCEYDRNTEYQKGFEDGANRPAGYVRGYLKW